MSDQLKKGWWETVKEHPRGFWFIFWGELAERSSFYGMRAILALYMVDILGFSKARSGIYVSAFIMACYILPLVGGWIADRYLGKFKTIIYFAVPYVLGHIVIGEWQANLGLIVALALLAGGSGTIKPNISTLMGLMYEEQGKKHLLTQAFSWFYGAINIGAATSMIMVPWVRSHFGETNSPAYGYKIAFMVPAGLMVASLLLFYLGKRNYPKEKIAKASEVVETPEQKAEKWRVIRNLSGVFAIIVFFWSVFDQAASTWVFMARDYLDLSIFGLFSIDADQMQGLNPVLIIILIPFFNWLWGAIKRKRGGEDLHPTHKMTLGFFLVVFAMAVMSIAGFLSGAVKVSIFWQALCYILITMAELCISVVGLEFAFTQAPARLKSTIMALFLLTVFAGNFIAGWYNVLYDKLTLAHGAKGAGMHFGIITIVMVVISLVFVFVGKKYREKQKAGLIYAD